MNHIRGLWEEEDAVGIVEVILILVVLIALVVLFRDKIEDIMKKAFASITSDGEKANKKLDIN
ncbi:Flp1 family type IVb pilin [Anaeromicropila herbilytica]|uniref:Putative Flagellin Flp1-like domain-containing protein n=1 Tax=Anaeromicropila herbilytica TaxID=2785025 RepID=A0A7R7EQ02_9FIRM|nr:Flp1 family type IVb pilin [Anaeromicropila herbilytica]BCN32935.1 hypothetical protein bsdtb5_42300 [Anaeromicropila herbilytica]